MDEKQSQALANELAKNLKTPDDISQFERLLKKIRQRPHPKDGYHRRWPAGAAYSARS
ncbi:transposase [Erwinia tracheiphila PSU-1]|nr:hypothetical protein [Erwinia tracheiphila]EOS96249.1 transposase [Erwinia tracheiphila PSU-1]